MGGVRICTRGESVESFPRWREERKRKREKKRTRRYVRTVLFGKGGADDGILAAVGRQGRRKLPGGFSRVEHEPIGGMGLKRPRSEPRSFAG